MPGFVREFQGPYRFLSNFWPAPIEYIGLVYPTVENAYQAAKSNEPRVWERFVRLSPGDAKRAGRSLILRRDWNEVKEKLMEHLVTVKFTMHEDLGVKLLRTGDMELQEGNYWGDRFWGVDLRTGIGDNRLGKILMHVRTTLRHRREMVRPKKS